MDWIEVIVLGVVQGITEFLPISSSGHLILVPELFGWAPRGIAFDTMVHLATLVAVLVVFWEEVWKMVRGVVGVKSEKEYGRLGWMIAVSTIPVVAFGLLFDDWIETTLRAPEVVAASLIGWGVMLGAADLWSRKRKAKASSDTSVGWSQAVSIGVAQMLALIPGTSRSGITMTAGLFAGLDRKTAARFSFLLSIPAVTGATVFVFAQAIQEGVNLLAPDLLLGFFVAMLSGILAIRFLLKLIEQWSFLPYAVYRIVLGIIILALL